MVSIAGFRFDNSKIKIFLNRIKTPLKRFLCDFTGNHVYASRYEPDGNNPAIHSNITVDKETGSIYCSACGWVLPNQYSKEMEYRKQQVCDHDFELLEIKEGGGSDFGNFICTKCGKDKVESICQHEWYTLEESNIFSVWETGYGRKPYYSPWRSNHISKNRVCIKCKRCDNEIDRYFEQVQKEMEEENEKEEIALNTWNNCKDTSKKYDKVLCDKNNINVIADYTYTKRRK